MLVPHPRHSPPLTHTLPLSHPALHLNLKPQPPSSDSPQPSAIALCFPSLHPRATGPLLSSLTSRAHYLTQNISPLHLRKATTPHPPPASKPRAGRYQVAAILAAPAQTADCLAARAEHRQAPCRRRQSRAAFVPSPFHHRAAICGSPATNAPHTDHLHLCKPLTLSRHLFTPPRSPRATCAAARLLLLVGRPNTMTTSRSLPSHATPTIITSRLRSRENQRLPSLPYASLPTPTAVPAASNPTPSDLATPSTASLNTRSIQRRPCKPRRTVPSPRHLRAIPVLPCSYRGELAF